MDFLREEAQFSLTHVGVSGPSATSLGQGERGRKRGRKRGRERERERRGGGGQQT